MKSRRKKIAAILVILLVALILNAMLTWGIIFDHDGGFEMSRTYLFEDILIENQRCEIIIGDGLSSLRISIPFVFYVYGLESPPYPIRLEISDKTGTFEEIFIESVTIEYVEGQRIEHKINWKREFENTTLLTSVDAKNTWIPVEQLYDKLPVTVDRRESCNIRFIGHFVSKVGVKIPFDTTKSFEYEAHNWGMYPLAGSF